MKVVGNALARLSEDSVTRDHARTVLLGMAEKVDGEPLSDALAQAGMPLSEIKASLDRLDARDGTRDGDISAARDRLSAYYPCVDRLDALLSGSVASPSTRRLMGLVETRLISTLPAFPTGPAPVGTRMPLKLTMVTNALDRLTDDVRTWVHARDLLRRATQSDVGPLAAAFRRLGESLEKTRSDFDRMEELDLGVGRPAAVWRIRAHDLAEVHGIQRRLSTCHASIQEIHALLVGAIAPSQLRVLEIDIEVRLIPLIGKLMTFAMRDRDASPLTAPLVTALNARPIDPQNVRVQLARFTGRLEATGRYANHAMAWRDLQTSPSAAAAFEAHALGDDILRALLTDTYDRALWGAGSLISAAENSELESDAVTRTLDTFARSRRMVYDVAHLNDDAACSAKSAALFRMLERVQELIGDLEGAAAKLAEDGWDKHGGRRREPHHAFEDVKRTTATWRAIADDLIRTASGLAETDNRRLADDVIKNAVDAYFTRIDGMDRSDPRQQALSLATIEQEARSRINGDELVALDALSLANSPPRAASRGRRRPRSTAGGASTRPGSTLSVNLPASVDSSRRATAAEATAAASQATAWMDRARKEAAADNPDRRLILGYLANGKNCLARVGSTTADLVPEARTVLRQVDRAHWRLRPSEALYLALKDDIKVRIGVEERAMPRVTDSGRTRAPGELIEEVLLRLEDPKDSTFVDVVMHVHRIPGTSKPPLAHFKLAAERYHASRQGHRVHRGFLNHAGVWREILERAGKPEP